MCSADEDGAPTVLARVPGLAVCEQCRPLHPELQIEPEDMYSRFRKAVEDVNVSLRRMCSPSLLCRDITRWRYRQLHGLWRCSQHWACVRVSAHVLVNGKVNATGNPT